MNRVRVDAATLTIATGELLAAAGMREVDARLAADVLVAADLRGVETHGVSNMLPVYLDWLRRGHVNPTPSVRLLRESPGTATLDGDRGLGVVIAPQAMRTAIGKARQVGIGAVSVGNSRHLGMAAYHAMLALDLGMVGVCTSAVGPLVVPTFGREPRLGTNPIAVAVPTADEPPFVFDAATSVIAGNQITEAHRAGKPLPPGVIAGPDGRPIMTETAAPDGYAGSRLLPLGSNREAGSHKGYGLATVVEVLGSVLSGTPLLLELGSGHAAHFVLALDVAAFTDPVGFRHGMDALLRALKATPPAAGQERVIVAGQLEAEAEQVRRRDGIAVHAEVLAWFDAACAEAGLPRLTARLGSLR